VRSSIIFREINSLKKIISLLYSVLVCGCGEGVYQPGFEIQGVLATEEQAVVCTACDIDIVQSSIPGTHGYEINLPVGDQDYLPPEWYWESTEVGPLVYRQDNARTGLMDWGGGNALYNILSPSRPPFVCAPIYKGSGYQVVGHVTGLFSNIQPGMVRGSAELMIEEDSQPVPQNYHDIELALQVYNGANWTDVATKTLYTGGSPYFGELEAMVQPGTQVRLEIRALRSSTWGKLIYISKVRMFGAQCYPDFANPGSCL
jgi:hypothetical protein